MSSPPINAFDRVADEKQVYEEFASRYAETTGVEVTEDTTGADVTEESGIAIPFQNPSQQTILINVTHRNQRPHSKMAGFRICGAFPNVDELTAHVSFVGGVDAFGRASLFAVNSHKKFVLCASERDQQDSTYTNAKLEAVSSQYMSTLNFHTDEFNANKQSRQQGKTGLSKNEKVYKFTTRSKALDEKFETDAKQASQRVAPLHKLAEVRRQSVAVISIINDTTSEAVKGLRDPEPVVIVWGCFEAVEDAKHYIKHTATKYVRDVCLYIVDMYEWVYPAILEKRIDEIEEEYRNPTLSKVMNARKAQKQKVMSYEEFCRKEGQTAATLEITATKETEDSTEVKTIVKTAGEMKAEVATVKSVDSEPNVSLDSTPPPPVSWNVMPQSKDPLYKHTTFKTEEKSE